MCVLVTAAQFQPVFLPLSSCPSARRLEEHVDHRGLPEINGRRIEQRRHAVAVDVVHVGAFRDENLAIST